ncbi:MAG: alpha/beta hydrolase [Chloroflexi bacterium]|nr:alpha/beta hydrolase [Chloroflexota bacterium]
MDTLQKTVTSKDGTRIAYDQRGQGPVVILVAGALGVRSPHPVSRQLAELLSQHFTVIDYDRRGRGDSSDTPPYALEREVEDIEALMDATGGTAFVYGLSSGAVLALEAASRLPRKVKKLALYEPPFIINDSRPPVPDDYVKQLQAAIAAGRPGDAVEIFMTKAILIPPEFVAQMRTAPMNQVFGPSRPLGPAQAQRMPQARVADSMYGPVWRTLRMRRSGRVSMRMQGCTGRVPLVSPYT